MKSRVFILMVAFTLFFLDVVAGNALNDKPDKSSLVGPRFFQSPLGEYDNGYPKERYQFVLNQFKQVYGPIIARRGGQLKILSDWTDGAVNMWAWRIGSEYWLEIPGGMSRYYLIIEEAFVLSICHELGHLLGGLPLKGRSPTMPITIEGQSDYFATLKCMRRMLTVIDEYKTPEEGSHEQSDPERVASNSRAIKETCQSQPHWPNFQCVRSLRGALSLTSYYAKLEKVPFPKIETPSSVVVAQTLKVHPPAQCRLDTYVAGVACRANLETDLSYEDPATGACLRQKSEKGFRPRCWFKFK